MESSLAVMQPYLFPYIGYFQLINTVDSFIFYDDVDFITNGWINRNNILINGTAKYFTVPITKKTQNGKINRAKLVMDSRTRNKLLKKVKFTYSNAPFFNSIYPIYKTVLQNESDFIFDFAIDSVKRSSEYLGIETKFKISSKEYNNTELDRADRLIDITQQEGARNYINAVGGKELYDKAYFKKQGISLFFLESEKIKYEQFGDNFVPNLSIIDVMMFNAPEKIRNNFLQSYKLV